MRDMISFPLSLISLLFLRAHECITLPLVNYTLILGFFFFFEILFVTLCRHLVGHHLLEGELLLALLGVLLLLLYYQKFSAGQHCY